MRNTALLIIGALASTIFLSAPALAGPADDATAFVTSIIDKFNGGDVNAFLTAHVDSPAIVDEFGPHVWTGAGAAKHWLDDYAAMTKVKGVSGGRVDYGKPLRAESDGKTAYIILPTTYRYTQNGTKLSETGSMTFVVNNDGKSWKIVSWTFSGAPPEPEK